MIPKRVVLDTNVCLDLFVFDDPRWRLLKQALRNRTLQAVTRSDCRREWQIVLGYSHLPVDAVTRPKIEQEFDALITCLDTAPGDATPLRLPLCKDTDDQKFLELARDTNASVLITKDKALLKLNRKTVAAGLFAIITPATWLTLATAAGTAQNPSN